MHFLRAVKPILRDLLSTLVFVTTFWLTGNIIWATGLGIALGIAQTLWYMLSGRSIGALQWLSLVLVTGLGMTTIVTGNSHFIMVKPTLIALAFGAIMLRRDWMAPYLPPIVTDNLDDLLIVRAGYAWAALMFVLAVLNLVFAFLFSAKIWSWYLAVVPPLSYMALLTVQYFMFRKHVIQKIRARAEAQAA